MYKSTSKSMKSKVRQSLNVSEHQAAISDVNYVADNVAMMIVQERELSALREQLVIEIEDLMATLKAINLQLRKTMKASKFRLLTEERGKLAKRYEDLMVELGRINKQLSGLRREIGVCENREFAHVFLEIARASLPKDVFKDLKDAALSIAMNNKDERERRKSQEKDFADQTAQFKDLTNALPADQTKFNQPT